MKNFIAMHTFKSAALRDQCFEAMGTMSEQELVAGMTGDKAQCQMRVGTMVVMAVWCSLAGGRQRAKTRSLSKSAK